MKVYVYPADEWGCGYYRLIWPARQLIAEGHDVEIVMPKQRGNSLQAKLKDNTVVSVTYPPDADVIVLQRITHEKLVQAIKLITEEGVAVVIDMDDDLAAIDPSNPAFLAMHPRLGMSKEHSWIQTQRACEVATYVTVSTDALLPRYAPHGRGIVLRNRVPRRYLDIPHDYSVDIIGWGGTVRTHPNDMQVVGTSISQLVPSSTRFRVVGPRDKMPEILRVDDEYIEATGPQDLQTEWPQALAQLGVGIAPLADTRFNKAKSWLKPLEYSAVGVPCVMSPRDEYRRVHAERVGLLAEKPRHWISKLRHLVGSQSLREELGQAGREWASRNTIEEHAWRWLEAWDEARKIAQK